MEGNKHLYPIHNSCCDASHACVPARKQDLIKARSIRGFRFTESLHQGFITPHSHEHATVTALLNGQFEESYSHSQEYCETQSILLRPAGIQHSDQIGEAGAHLFVFEIYDHANHALSDFSQLVDEVTNIQDGRLNLLIQKMRSELQIDDEAALLSLEGLALEFFAHLLRTRSSKKLLSPDWLKRGADLIRDRFKDSNIQIKDIALETGIHPVHFSRAFKKHFGMTPGRFLRKTRIDWSSDQLKLDKKTIAEIALEAGFADQSHFGRLFKHQKGYTPSQWRKFHTE